MKYNNNTTATATGNSSKRKIGGYNSSILRAKRNQKRHEAEARNQAWSDLTPKQQLASLAGRRGESKRQVARIQAANKS